MNYCGQLKLGLDCPRAGCAILLNAFLNPNSWEDHMPVVSLEQLRPGLVLAADMKTVHGRLLAGSGSRVTAELLKIARIWGITEAEVEGGVSDQPQSDPLAELNQEQLKLLNALTDWRFTLSHENSPWLRGLKKIFRKRAAAEMLEKGPRQVIQKYRGPVSDPRNRCPLVRPAQAAKLEQLVQSEVQLASLPDVFHEIVRVMNDPLSSATHIAEVISRDTSLSSRMLRLVNSSFYSFMSRIDTLSRAVTIVGTVEITNLAMGISIISMFRDIPEELVDMRSFWQHSIAAGVIARILATRTGHPGQEQVFVGGLLHDLGRMVLIRHYPETCAAMFEHAAARPCELPDLEQKVLGYSHALLGAGLLKEWKIPASLQAMVKGHHDFCPEESDPALLIHMADIISHALGLGKSGSRRVPQINPGIWEKTGLPLSTLPSLISQAENQIRDLMRIIVQENDHAG